MTAPLYNQDILRLAVSIPHLDAIDNPQASAERRSAICGSYIKITVRLDAEGRLAALQLTPRACALGQASAAILGQSALGKTLAELELARDNLRAFLGGTSEIIGDWRGLEILAVAKDYPARHASIRLPFEAICDAVAQAQSPQHPSTAK